MTVWVKDVSRGHRTDIEVHFAVIGFFYVSERLVRPILQPPARTYTSIDRLVKIGLQHQLRQVKGRRASPPRASRAFCYPSRVCTYSV